MRNGIASLILSVLLFWGCSQPPPLRIIASGDMVTVDVQTLGEYRTTIDRIRLVDKSSGDTIWELKAQSGTPQIHQIELKIGENPAILNGVLSGTYAVVTPNSTGSFTLVTGVEYEISIWGSDRESSRITGTFRLAKKVAKLHRSPSQRF